MLLYSVVQLSFLVKELKAFILFGNTSTFYHIAIDSALDRYRRHSDTSRFGLFPNTLLQANNIEIQLGDTVLVHGGPDSEEAHTRQVARVIQVSRQSC